MQQPPCVVVPVVLEHLPGRIVASAQAGAAGGEKGVPETVSSHPMVFATLTAPSFGAVHASKKPGSKSLRCRPRTRGEVCRHGKTLSCMDIHAEHDPVAGKPFCADCYDYAAHVIWQWWAPELWRRFTIALPRLIANALVSHRSRQGGWSAREAVTSVEFQPPPVSQAAPGYLLRFGTQVEARPVHRRAGRDDLCIAIHPETVAAYIAKYSTKSATDLDPAPGHQTPPCPNPVDRVPALRARRPHLPARTARAAKPILALGEIGRTCSASVATSRPSPAATPPPSAGFDPPGDASNAREPSALTG